VLADPVSPQVVAAITPRQGRGVEVDPMLVATAYHVVSATADSPAVELETSLESIQIDAARCVEVNENVCHCCLLCVVQAN